MGLTLIIGTVVIIITDIIIFIFLSAEVKHYGLACMVS